MALREREGGPIGTRGLIGGAWFCGLPLRRMRDETGEKAVRESLFLGSSL